MNNKTDNVDNVEEDTSLARQNLAQLGFAEVSLFPHDQILRIQIPEADFERAIQMREEIVSHIKPLGYRFVAIDLDGRIDD